MCFFGEAFIALGRFRGSRVFFLHNPFRGVHTPPVCSCSPSRSILARSEQNLKVIKTSSLTKSDSIKNSLPPFFFQKKKTKFNFDRKKNPIFQIRSIMKQTFHFLLSDPLFPGLKLLRSRIKIAPQNDVKFSKTESRICQFRWYHPLFMIDREDLSS